MARKRKFGRGNLRVEAAIGFLRKFPRSTSYQIIEGAKFGNGKLLRSHGQLGMTSREMTAMLIHNPILFQSHPNPQRGSGGLMWSLQADVE